METVVKSLNSIIWGWPLISLCLGAGFFFSRQTRYLQIRHLKEMIRLLFSNKSSEGGLSSFQALSVALSGRVGTGNIAGVATAIGYGGPGAIFWMWCIAFVGSATAYVESTLAQIYKEEKDGQYRGGPAYYIEKCLGYYLNKATGKNVIATFFAMMFGAATVIATGIFLPGVQSNSIAEVFKNAFQIPYYTTGAVVALLFGFIIFGGIKRIGKVAQFVVPLMATIYVLVAIVVIALNIEKIPQVISLIFSSAFGVNAAFGGIWGSAVAWGVKRGIYSNEAGQGTGAQAAAAAEVDHPAQQGLVQAFSVYIDTLLVCSATAFIILSTGMYNVVGADKKTMIVENLPHVEIGPAFTQIAVNHHFPGFGPVFVAVSLFLFAFTTLMAYYYIAETNLVYFGKGKRSVFLIYFLRLAMVGVVFYGSIHSAKLVWDMGDIGVGIMAWINFIAILILFQPALLALKDYERQMSDKGREKGKFHFDPIALGIHNAHFWEARLDAKQCEEAE